MFHDDHLARFNFKFSQCNLLDEPITTDLDIPSTTHHRKNKKNDQISEQQITRPMNAIENNVSCHQIFSII
jgi:hypothetical protein